MPHQRLYSLPQGFLAGVVATLPMTAVMLLLDRRSAQGDVHPLPPRQITEEAVGLVADDPGEVEEGTYEILTGLNHLGYGGTMGAVFAATCGPTPSHAVAKGVGFGLAVWAGSYLGWLPAVQSHAAAREQSLQRNGIMIAAHVVWGASLGALMQRFAERSCKLSGSTHRVRMQESVRRAGI